MNSDKSFKLRSLNVRQVLCCDVDQLIQNGEEFPICRVHHALVIACVLERRFWLSRPYHLQAQQADLHIHNHALLIVKSEDSIPGTNNVTEPEIIYANGCTCWFKSQVQSLPLPRLQDAMRCGTILVIFQTALSFVLFRKFLCNCNVDESFFPANSSEEFRRLQLSVLELWEILYANGDKLMTVYFVQQPSVAHNNSVLIFHVLTIGCCT